MAWSEFYGSLRGRSNEVTRCGDKESGLHMVAASKTGAVRVHLWHTDGKHCFSVRITDWGSSSFSAVPILMGHFPTGDGNPVFYLPDEVVRAHVEREALKAMKED